MRILGIAALACAVSVAGGARADEPFRVLRLDGFQLKWGAPEQGLPAQVTYRLVDRPIQVADAINCEDLEPIDALLASNDIAAARFAIELKAAFAAWAGVAAVRFVPVDSGPADILIGAQSVPRGHAFTNVKYDAAGARRGVAQLTQSLICLNPERSWKVGFDGNLDAYDLRYVLIHEIGHAIGLNHPTDRRSLMYHAYGEAFRAPQTGDIAGAVAIYGEPVQTVVSREDRAPARDPAKGDGDGRSISIGIEPQS